MKKITLIISFLAAVVSVQAQGIEFFKGTWEEAVAEAKKQDKLIFVDAFASWCGPCKAMARNVFPDEQVGQYYNANFINIQWDMEKDPEGVKFRKKYPVSAFPTLYYIDYTGEVVQNIRGAQQIDKFIELGRNALAKVDRSGLFAAEYEKGNRDPELVLNYVKALNKAGKPSLAITNDYLRDQQDLTSDTNLRIILEGTAEADSRVFDLLIENRKAIAKLASEDEIQHKILGACQATAQKAISFQSQDLLETAKSLMKKHYPAEAADFAIEADMDFALDQRDAKTFLAASKDYMSKVADHKPAEYVRLSNVIMATFPRDNRAVKQAEDFAREAAERSNAYEFYYTYAQLLNKLGKNKEALDAANKALDLAKDKNQAAQRMIEAFIQRLQEG